MLVFLCVLSWVGVVYFRSIPYLSWELEAATKKDFPSLSTSVAVTHDIICTDLILHFFFKTLDLYVYVVMSDFFFLSSQFLAGTFSGFLCTVLLLLTPVVTGETLFIIPAYTKSHQMISQWPMHASWTLKHLMRRYV